MNAPAPPARQSPRGSRSGLHEAAFLGRTECIDALLAAGSTDIDQGDPSGNTPLMMAADQGFSSTTKLLLSKGADASAANDEGCTALHFSARKGYLAATKMLVKAGANVETRTLRGLTPLHIAAIGGHAEVIRVLIEAGAKVDNRMLNEQTPLYGAAAGGHMDAVKVLLRAKADPSLGPTIFPGETSTPLDAAAAGGHLKIIRELMTRCGIAGCGGADGLVRALHVAVGKNRVDVMAALFDGGGVDTGQTLMGATLEGREACVKFLLQQQDKENASAYVNFVDANGTTPLLCSVASISCPPRVVRLLVDAGADTTTAAPLRTVREGEIFHGTPLALTVLSLHEQKVAGTSASEKQLNRLEGIRRLLLQVEAVHAVSWLWAWGRPRIADSKRRTTRTKTRPTQLRSMVLIMRRPAGARRVVLTAAFRYSTKA